MRKFKCLYHNVLVKLEDRTKVSGGGIIIPDVVEQARHTGVVEYTGSGMMLPDGKIRPMTVKVGDRVLFGKFAGLPLKINGIDYKHMREDEIIGIIEDKEDWDIEDSE